MTHFREGLRVAGPFQYKYQCKACLVGEQKRVEREMGQSQLFLATVDENIAANAIYEMVRMGVVLVVP